MADGDPSSVVIFVDAHPGRANQLVLEKVSFLEHLMDRLVLTTLFGGHSHHGFHRVRIERFPRGIKGLAASSAAVTALEEVDVSGASGALLTFSGIEATGALVWERDGLLLELETDCLPQADLLIVARSVR